MVGEIKVLVLERHEVVRLGLASILESVDEVVECRCAPSLDECDREGAPPPDVVVGSPGSSAAARDGARRLVLITGGDRDDIESAISVKADGYLVLQDVTAESLREALLAVLSGEMRLPDEMTMYMLDVARGDGSGAPVRMPRLSPREGAVLELLVAGHSNQEIVTELGISIHGVKRHVSSILAKFDSPSRSHLVSRVLQWRAAHALGA